MEKSYWVELLFIRLIQTFYFKIIPLTNPQHLPILHSMNLMIRLHILNSTFNITRWITHQSGQFGIDEDLHGGKVVKTHNFAYPLSLNPKSNKLFCARRINRYGTNIAGIFIAKLLALLKSSWRVRATQRIRF